MTVILNCIPVLKRSHLITGHFALCNSLNFVLKRHKNEFLSQKLGYVCMPITTTGHGTPSHTHSLFSHII